MSGRHRHESVAAAPRPTSRGMAASCVVAVLAAVACVVLWVHHRANEQAEAASREALAAARVAAQDILSYDYRSIADGVARAKKETTGAFAAQYADTAGQLLTEAKQVQAIVQASVGSAGVVDANGDDVVVLLFVDQASVKQPPGQKSPVTRIDQSRVRMTMTRVHGRWLVSALAAL